MSGPLIARDDADPQFRGTSEPVMDEAKVKHILLQYPGNIERALFYSGARDNCAEPFIRLRKEARALGYVIAEPSRPTLRDAAWLLFWDVPSATNALGLRGHLRRLRFGFSERTRNWLAAARRAGLDHVAVILWEPATVCSENWRPELYEHFDKVLTWNDDLVDGNRFQKFFLPVPEEWPVPREVDFATKKLLVNISSNKYSDYAGDLYSHRAEAIRYFESTLPTQFDLFGQGWDRPAIHIGDKRGVGWFRRSDRHRYSSFRGPITHKWDVLPNYKFAICYENALDQPGLVTEKMFDVMRCNCVPIYLGAPNISDYVDRNAFIDRRTFSSNAEVGEYLAGMPRSEYDRYLESIRSFLRSERFQRFKSGAFTDRIIDILGLSGATQ